MEDALSLPEQLLLLCLNDMTGRNEEPWLLHGLEGAVAAELMLQGRVGIEEDRLLVLDATPTGDALLNLALSRIAAQGKPRRLHEWVGRLVPNNPYPSEPVLKDTLSQRLVERGILTRQEGRLLWVLPDVAYPSRNSTTEEGLRAQVRQALLGDGPVEERLAALIALLHAAEALDQVLSEDERTAANARIQELCRQGSAGHSSDAVSSVVTNERVLSNFMAMSSLFELVVAFIPDGGT